MSESIVLQRMKAAGVRVRGFFARNWVYFASFGLPVLVLFVSYIFFKIYPFGERSVLSLDLNAQYVYYYDYMYDVFAGKESLFYSWSRNLSGEFAGIIGYYLASPFNWLVWIFPRTRITEGLMVMMLAKAGASGLTTAFLLRKHRGFSEITTLVFSLMFALCGFFVVQTMNPMWLDGIVALPLVVMGVERICDKRKFLLYVFSLVYIFVANFYIGYMVGIFSALYFVYYLASGKSKNSCAGEYCGCTIMYGLASVSAILMSCFMILPVYKSLSNGKFEFSTPDYSLKENFNITDIFIKLFPTSYDTVRMEGMPILYAGTLALVFAAIYFLSRRFTARERISGGVLLGALVICMYIRPVDMLWHGGQMPNWLPYRYSFLISFLLVLFGAQAFENIKKLRGRSFGIAFGILLAMLLIAEHGDDNERYREVLTFVVPLAVLVIMCIMAYVFRSYGGNNVMKILLAAAVTLECFLNTYNSLELMHKDIVFSNRSTYLGDIPYSRKITEQVHENDDGFYRMEKTYHRCVNDPIALRMYGMSHSSSTLNSTAIKLLQKLGYSAREHYTRYDGNTLLTDDIFGVKYILANDPNTIPYTDTMPIETELPVKVYKNEDALGFAYLAGSGCESLEFDDEIQPFESQNELARALAGDDTLEIFKPLHNMIFNSENIRTGTTTDAHYSYRKKEEDDEAWISYTLTADREGAVYMYLPTKYERETELYIDDIYRGNYFRYENFSIEYLGEYEEDEEFEVRLKLKENAVYFTAAEFYYLDNDELARFQSIMQQKNAATTLERVGGCTLKLDFTAEKGDVIFTSIPVEEGWTAYLDGVETELVSCVDQSLLCVEVPEGTHTLVLDFFPAGLMPGLVMTAAGAALLIVMISVSHLLKAADEKRLLQKSESSENPE
ncbi:MAG: YfhO family protein [Oscillospiraceae bacterium]